MKKKYHWLRRGLFAAGVVAASWAAGPISSGAAKVYVDPDGPAGQEYALPLDSARGEASGTPDAGVPEATTKVPLFGQGIRPNDSAAGDRPGSRSPGQDSGSGTARAVNAGDARLAAADGGSTTLPVAAVIAAIVLIGAGAGLIVHRRFPPAPKG